MKNVNVSLGLCSVGNLFVQCSLRHLFDDIYLFEEYFCRRNITIFMLFWFYCMLKKKQISMLVLTCKVVKAKKFPKHRDKHSLNHILLTKPLNWKTIFTPQSKRLSNNHINLLPPIPQNNYSVTILMICERCGVKKWKSSHSEVLAIQIVTPDKTAMIY